MSEDKKESAASCEFGPWYEEHYHELCGGGVWLRGGEVNTLPAEEYEERRYRVLFARLSSYFDTRESFTSRVLYQIASSVGGVFPDLAYLPPKQDAAVFKRDGVPWLLGTQTKKRTKSF